MLHPDEPSDTAALQSLDTLFAVPQVSMRLDSLSRAHTAMLMHYLAYWRANREVLLDGHSGRRESTHNMI
ncbi:hypothetical protein F4693_001547 [Sphingomonas endophytica]|uniref:Uncharacterized protein n=1 Tax=Sphingomonas endophytica TaxID=869719 RepID=A0A7X0MMS4_9SPHN|nr:hypothetical protein [Sphingomonas endophytica]MBB6504574.1 hypothetical protein [Sphingomonas endophytica]